MKGLTYSEPEIGAVVGGCRIEREIGRGGMGVVYLAEQEDLGRKVALKVIAPQLAQDAGFRERFVRESRLAAAIDHPNVVPVYSAGEDAGLLFIAMRYVSGTDLRAVLAGEGRLAPERAARIASQIAAALDAAHASGLIHRDVKPGNVLLTGPGSDEHAYLSDFGLMKDASSQSAMTQTGHWVGTLDYVAPEQLGHAGVDARADNYALGCMLFEMLAGQVPYQGTDVQKMWGHVNSPVPSLSAFTPELAAAFDPVLQRAMAKSPEDRYQSAGDLGRAATAAAQGTAVTLPERSVATGTAAPGAPIAILAGNGASGAHTRAEPTRVDLPPAGTPQTVAQRTPRPRSTWVFAAIALLAMGLAAGVLLGTGTLGGGSADDAQPAAEQVSASETSTGKQKDAKAEPEQPKKTPADSEQQAPPPPEPAPATTVSYKPYTSANGGYSTVVPTGGGWSVGSETNENTPDNPRYHVEIYGPNGVVIWIESTPFETAIGPSSGVTSSSTISHPAFGSADVYTFSSGTSPCTSKCVDYVMQGGESSGYAVLGGGGDFALAERVAKKIATSMQYYDY